eukprot:TRINITY_DN3091_c0_g1_i1.p1 TRINITY_DN3091_c0_g1~~TRINITY_DN3091_c0_g1_i1.p1  ORF type:complete len:205 (+),score=29.81 TRINITY_DN3091_c0_g1_i1:187-801(+)
MGREVRIFFQDTPMKFDLSQFGVKFSEHYTRDEADYYYHLGSKKYGLKRRGGYKLELKVLEKEEGKCGKWEKVIHTDTRSPKINGRMEDMIDIAQTLKNFKNTQEVLKVIEGREFLVVEARKKRHQVFIKIGTIEQTDLEMFLIGVGDERIHLGNFRSICLEDGQPNEMIEYMERIAKEVGGTVWWMSYPEFISMLLSSHDKHL